MATRVLAGLILVGAVAAQSAIELPTSTGGRFRIDPAQLRVDHVDGDGRVIPLANAVPELAPVAKLVSEQGGAHWSLASAGLDVVVRVEEDRLHVLIVRWDDGEMTWPSVPCAGARGVALPAFEGVWIGTDDREMTDWLRACGSMRVTEALTLPVFGVLHEAATAICLLPDPYYHQLAFDGGDELTAHLSHRWTANRSGAVNEVVFIVTPDQGPLGPALAYREWLAERGELVTLAQKAEANPAVDGLRGAIHAYVWGDATFSRHAMNRPKWRAFATQLLERDPSDEGSLQARLWARLSEEERDAFGEIASLEYPYRYVQDVASRGIARALADPSLVDGGGEDEPATVLARNAAALREAFPDLLPASGRWGDGCSTVLLEQIAAAGIERAVLCSSDFDDAARVPAVAAKARELRFLLGPYDSYHSIHSPDAHPDSTWRTAQFDRELYESGRIVGLDGEESSGFKKRGYHLSPVAARPWVERRVGSRMATVPCGAWFVDCDGFGQFFDDTHPDHPATREDDAAARRERLRWMSEVHGLVVGSEGATAVMAPAIHFAHGILTPVFGWGDPILHDRESEYWVGGYWPPDEPRGFFEPVPVHPKYRRPYFDPRDRLPLYQAALGDAVVATHHWGAGSRKFAGENGTRQLLELLYLVPPLYHLNRGTWVEQKKTIVAHAAFFAPLHRALATQPMTGFAWLSEDKLVQRTTFAGVDGPVHVTANFAEEVRSTPDGLELPARSVTVSGALSLETMVFVAVD